MEILILVALGLFLMVGLPLLLVRLSWTDTFPIYTWRDLFRTKYYRHLGRYGTTVSPPRGM